MENKAQANYRAILLFGIWFNVALLGAIVYMYGNSVEQINQLIEMRMVNQDKELKQLMTDNIHYRNLSTYYLCEAKHTAIQKTESLSVCNMEEIQNTKDLLEKIGIDLKELQGGKE